MSEIKTNTISLVVNGKTIEIKTPTKLNFELNKELATDGGFTAFVSDPQAFAKKYDLNIDADIANQLKTKLSGIKNLSEMQAYMGKGGGEGGAGATAWAVAVGAYSIASTKIAIAV